MEKKNSKKMTVSILGGSGFAGGELIRLLLQHPKLTIKQVTSQSYHRKPVTLLHPNLVGATNLRFCSLAELEPCDIIFIAYPHGKVFPLIPQLEKLAPYLIDLSADFRLQDPAQFQKWYHIEHQASSLIPQFVYGIPEIHREEMRKTRRVAGAGCLATGAILGLYPLAQENLIQGPVIIEGKMGSSGSGYKTNRASMHAERSGTFRYFAPTQHRHIAEISQELSLPEEHIHFTAAAIERVRGESVSSHIFLKENLSEKELWQIYRKYYSSEHFIRIIKKRQGLYRYPEPKILMGTNFCDIGFEKEENSNRVIVMSALDNLMKGAAGQAVQAMNIVLGFPEETGLTFQGLHPI